LGIHKRGEDEDEDRKDDGRLGEGALYSLEDRVAEYQGLRLPTFTMRVDTY